MYQVISVLVIIVSVLLVLIVLVQNAKGGGLASNFAASNQVLGVRKTTDLVEKATWILAGTLMVLSFVAVMVLPRGAGEQQSVIDGQIQNMAVPEATMPAFPIAEEPVDGATVPGETTE